MILNKHTGTNVFASTIQRKACMGSKEEIDHFSTRGIMLEPNLVCKSFFFSLHAGDLVLDGIDLCHILPECSDDLDQCCVGCKAVRWCIDNQEPNITSNRVLLCLLCSICLTKISILTFTCSPKSTLLFKASNHFCTEQMIPAVRSFDNSMMGWIITWRLNSKVYQLPSESQLYKKVNDYAPISAGSSSHSSEGWLSRVAGRIVVPSKAAGCPFHASLEVDVVEGPRVGADEWMQTPFEASGWVGGKTSCTDGECEAWRPEWHPKSGVMGRSKWVGEFGSALLLRRQGDWDMMFLLLKDVVVWLTFL